MRIDAVMRYRASTDGVLCVARCRELSSTGLTVRIDRPVFPGELVRFDLERTAGGTSVLGLARVSWVGTDPENGDPLMRLRFLRMTEASQGLVSAWLEEVSAVAERPSQPSNPAPLSEPVPVQSVTSARPLHHPSEDSTVRALSRAITESLLPLAPRAPFTFGAPSDAPSDETREVHIAPPPQIPSTPVPRGHSVPAPPRLSAATLAQHRVSGAPIAPSLAPPLSAPLPIGALINAPSDSARRSSPPAGLFSTPAPAPASLPQPPPPSGRPAAPTPITPPLGAIEPRVSSPAPAPAISERASLPLEGASLPPSDAPWSVPARPSWRWRQALFWPGTAQAWILLCLLSVIAGGALAYFVYGPRVLTDRLPRVLTARLESTPAMLSEPIVEPVPEPAAAKAGSRPRPAPSVQANAAPTKPSAEIVKTAEPELLDPSGALIPREGAERTASLTSPLALLRTPPNASLVVPKSAGAVLKTVPQKPTPIVIAPIAAADKPPPPPALPTALAQAPAAPAASPADTGTRLSRARACLSKGDTACAIALLSGASSEAELELWIETLRAEGRAPEARKQMLRYVNDFPNARRATAYRRILSNASP